MKIMDRVAPVAFIAGTVTPDAGRGQGRIKRGRPSKAEPIFPPTPIMHRRPILPEPECPDPGRRERLRVRTQRLVEMMLASPNREAAMVDVLRVRKIAALTDLPLEGAADRGATGPAALARRHAIETITDDVWDDARGKQYSRSEVMRYRDGVLDHYAEAGVLSGPELDAADELARLYRLAKATMVVPGHALSSYGVRAGRLPSESQEEYEARVWKDFNRAVDHIPRGSQAACVDVARGLFPGGVDAVHHMRWGFSALAKLWRMGC